VIAVKLSSLNNNQKMFHEIIYPKQLSILLICPLPSPNSVFDFYFYRDWGFLGLINSLDY